MKLIKVKVTNFRSVEDSTEFDIDDLTCLVGKNEAGKTAILQALHSISPLNKVGTVLDVDQDYPRRFVTRYNDRHPDGKAPVAQTWWEFDDATAEELAVEYGEAAISSRVVEVTRRYNSPGNFWTVPILEQPAVRYLIDQARLNAAEKKVLHAADTFSTVITRLQEIDSKTDKQSALLEQFMRRKKRGTTSLRGL